MGFKSSVFLLPAKLGRQFSHALEIINLFISLLISLENDCFHGL